MIYPKEHASLYSEGRIIFGIDGNKWIAKYNENYNQMEWQQFHQVQLNGYRALTIDYLRENIGKEIVIYEREYKYNWPSKIDSNLYVVKWSPNGDGMSMSNGIIIRNWLITQTPKLEEDDDVFLLLGFSNGNGNCDGDEKNELFEMALQVNSKDKKSVSSNIKNLGAFVLVDCY